ncbi:MAG: alpha/beta hydrolase [Halopseudomonas sp.]|uniref:alpha/beta fold hydrolase n=1 Tax=Halopseudomonas sp. TaxID=2901191 RepID=UPI003001FA26
MYAEKAVIRVHRDLQVHTWFYPNPAAESTIILVNGSLATSASFGQTLRYLQPLFNVVLFDQPYSGQSRPHNCNQVLIGKEDEALILLDLIEHFRADQVLSFSWGGVATMLALAQRPDRIKRAVITSFSPIINPAMQDYLARGKAFLAACDRQQIGHLINETIGEFLPPLFKRCNFRHVSSLDEQEYAQMLMHIRQVLELDSSQYMGCVSNIDIPLLFINGNWDKYTSPEDALHFGTLAPRAEFQRIAHTGHFLDLEHKTAWQDTRAAVENFVLRDTSIIESNPRQPMALAG